VRNLSRRPLRIAIGGVVVLSLVGFLSPLSKPGLAQDRPASKSTEGASDDGATKYADIPAQWYALPDEGGVPALLRFIEKVMTKQVQFPSEQQEAEFFTKSRTAILTAADKILASQPTAGQEESAIIYKLQAYQVLLMVGPPNTAANAVKFAEQLKHHKQPALAEAGEVSWFDFKMSTVPGMSAKDRRALVDLLTAALRKKPRVYSELAESFGRALENVGDGENAAAAYTNFGEVLSRNLDEKTRDRGEMLKNGAARRARLLTGEPIKVVGKTVDGKPFDINEYKGKVVIVDFWATWCAPCLAEMPHLKKLYEKYHGRGLEIVGVNVDTDGEALGKFLKDNAFAWKILHDPAQKADEDKPGFADPNAVYYGIMVVPTIILIDGKGKVISLGARGEQLATLVDGLVGGSGESRK
jgi:thiol-disulfide isomerase/thioredoxin